MSIARTFYPEWENLLVIPDEEPEDLGVAGINGEMLVKAERYKGRPRTGVVYAAGPDAPYTPGTRVVFDSHSTYDLSKYGGDKMILINSQQIRCYADGGEDASRPMDESWRDHILPPPGCVIVERAEMPFYRGRIKVPETFNAATRSSEATVLASDDPDGRFAKGDHVFLAGTTSKNIMLGMRGDVVLWIVRPREISGRLLGDPGLIEKQEHIAESDIAHLAELTDSSFGFEEGDQRGVR